MDMTEVATTTEIEQQVALLNRAWKKYAEAERYQYVHAMNLWNKRFVEACKWLGEQGYPWHTLVYDKATKTFSLPKK